MRLLHYDKYLTGVRSLYVSDRKSSNTHIRIYEDNFGPRPVDDKGRSYHIHHIDGDHSNNDPSNLLAVSPEQHYQIHIDQGDWAAALYLSQYLDMTGDEIKELARTAAHKRVSDGTHNFLGEQNPAKKKSRAGTHHWSGPSANAKRITNGTHNFLGERNPNHRRVEEGTHNFLGPELNRRRIEEGTHNFLGERNPNRRRVEDGTHNFLGERNPNHKRVKEGTHHFGKEFTKNLIESGRHVNGKIYQCPHCSKTGKGPVMKRHHFDRCKAKGKV
jgi:hypothetical protein